jgi:hypothetical protein
MSSIESIVDTEVLSTWIGLQTEASKKCLTQQLHHWTHDAQRLIQLSDKFKRFKNAFEKDPAFFGACHDIFKEISDIEKRLHHLIDGESELEKESYNEILFFHPILQPLNFVPFLLTLWSTIRIYVLPGISLLFPIITLLAPYIVLKFVFHLPMSFSNYMNMLHSIVSGNFQQIMNPQEIPLPSSVTPMAFLKQFGVVMVSFVQGIIQPYWSYKHLKSIDTIISDHGALVLRFQELYQSLEQHLLDRGFTFFRCPLPDIPNERNATARIILESSYFKLALKYVGSSPLKPSNIETFADGGSVEGKKKDKNFGKIGIKNSGSEIIATYLGKKDRSGMVSAKKMTDNLYTVGLSKATKGYGPKLYDIVMEAATANGGMLAPDRNMISGAAKDVWSYYFNKRSDVRKTPLDKSQWTQNSALIDPKLLGEKNTWPPYSDPAWTLQSGYSKIPDLLNNSIPSVKN